MYDVAIDSRGAAILNDVYRHANPLQTPQFWAGWAGSSPVAGSIAAGEFAILGPGGGLGVPLGTAI